MPSKLRPVLLSGLGALTVVMTIETLVVTAPYHGGFQIDFRADLYKAAQTIMRGANPYHPALLQAEVAILRAGGKLGLTLSPRYPPLSMLAVVPLSLLPFKVAAILFFLLSSLAIVGALWLLEVRDPRAIVVASITAPAAYGIWIGNPSPWLLLGVACVWRWRSRSIKLALATATTIGAKLLLWPLGAWMLITKRFRLFAGTVALTLLGLLAAWAVIGFKGLASYPQMLVNIAYIGELRGSSLVTVLLHLGLPATLARVVALACAAALVAAAWRLLLLPDGDRRAFGLITIAVVVASPVVWLHYFVLLYVPIALLSPTLSLFWFVPAFASFAPIPDVAIEFIVAAVVCAPLLRGSTATEPKPAPTAVRSRVRRLPIASKLLAPIA
jgi:hypothetical protein